MAYIRLGSLIDQLTTEQPNAAILVAKIIPAANNETMANIDALNAQIPGQPFLLLLIVKRVPITLFISSNLLYVQRSSHNVARRASMF